MGKGWVKCSWSIGPSASNTVEACGVDVVNEPPPCDPESRKVHHHHILIADSVPRSEGREIKVVQITPFCHSVMKYMVPSLVALVGLKYQGKPESLFVENSASLWCFLVPTCVYWLIVGGAKQMPTLDSKYLLILRRAASAIGVLSVLSLLSVLLPHRISFVPFVIWIFLLVILAMLYGAYTWLRSLITTLFINIRTKLVPRATSLPV